MNARSSPRSERDPYPKMIIAVIAITLLLFLLVAGVMAYDFIARGRTPSALPASAITDDEPPASRPVNLETGGAQAP